LENTKLSFKINEIKTTAEVITESLIELIHNVKLKPGQQLSQEKIAKMFGVSRVPVRDALQNIVNIGLAKRVPRKGIIVSPINIEVLKNLYDVRRLLEGHAVKLVIKNIRYDILKVLKRIIMEQNEAIKNDNKVEAKKLNEEFHSNLYCYSTTKNKILNDLIFYNRLRIIHAKNVSISNTIHEKKLVKNSPKNHKRIVSVIEKGDIVEAQQLIINIIKNSEKEVLINLDKMNFVESTN